MTETVMWLQEYERLLRDPAPGAFDAALDLKAENRPRSVFRYRAMSDLSLDSLRRGYVWLSKPISFNDEYDSAIVVDYDRYSSASFRDDLTSIVAKQGLTGELTESEILSIRESADPMRTMGALLLSREPEWASADTNAILDALGAAWRKVLGDLQDRTFQMARHAIRVGCFSASGTTPALWAYYADSGRGFCIEYDLTQLPPDDIRLRILFPVIYRAAPADVTFAFEAARSQGPNALTVRWPIIAASYKDAHWRHEQEWRLVRPDAGPGDGVAVPMPMKSVYLGTNISPDDANAVTSAAIQQGLSVYMMRAGRNASQLVFERAPHS